MKYRKGTQTGKLEDLEQSKVRLVRDGDGEGIWVRQGPDYVVLQNHAVNFIISSSYRYSLGTQRGTPALSRPRRQGRRQVLLPYRQTRRSRPHVRSRDDCLFLALNSNPLPSTHPQ